MLNDSKSIEAKKISFSYKDESGKKTTHDVIAQEALTPDLWDGLSALQKKFLISCLRYLALLESIDVTKQDLYRYANIFRDRILESARTQKPELKRELSNSSDSDDSVSSGFTVSPTITPGSSPESSIESKNEKKDDSPLDWVGVFNLLPENIKRLWAPAPEATLVQSVLFEPAVKQIAKFSQNLATISIKDTNEIKALIKARNAFRVTMDQTLQERFTHAVRVQSKNDNSLLPETLKLPRQQIKGQIESHPLSEEIEIDTADHFQRKKLQDEFLMMLCLPVENQNFDKARRVTNYSFRAAAVIFLLVTALLLAGVSNPLLIPAGLVMVTLLTSEALYEKCMHPDGPNYSTKAMLGSVGAIGVTGVSLMYGVLPLFLGGAALASVAAILWPVAICIAVCVLGAWIGTMTKGGRNNNFQFFKPKKEEEPTFERVVDGASNERLCE